MSPALQSELLGTAALWAAAFVALGLTWLRPLRKSGARVLWPFVIGLLFQAAHFLEENATGFRELFPARLGLAPWPSAFFLTFNLAWLAIWAISAVGLHTGSRAALFPVWFFALAAMANGVAHPVLAWLAGGYFPGLYTSPLLGIAGVWLLVKLIGSTERTRTPIPWRRIGLFFETIVFSVAVPGAVTYWIPRDVFDLWGDTSPHSWTARHFAALLPLALGLAIYLRCLWEFAARGRGIPAPIDHPKQLVVTGLYRYVRNPMYLGVLLVLLGEALFFGSRDFLLYTAGWLLFVHLSVLFYEEPNLRRKFDGSYEVYRRSVRRWIPGKPYN